MGWKSPWKFPPFGRICLGIQLTQIQFCDRNQKIEILSSLWSVDKNQKPNFFDVSFVCKKPPFEPPIFWNFRKNFAPPNLRSWSLNPWKLHQMGSKRLSTSTHRPPWRSWTGRIQPLENPGGVGKALQNTARNSNQNKGKMWLLEIFYTPTIKWRFYLWSS